MSTTVRFAPEPLSLQRILAWSAALLLHLAAFAALVAPLRAIPPRAVEAASDSLLTEFIARVVPVRLEPPPPIPSPPQRPPRQVETRAQPAPQPTPQPIADARLSEPVADPVPLADATPDFHGDAMPHAAAELGIAYLDAPPPPYPTAAIRRGLEGTVYLRVRVDAGGRPLEVLVERSSGHALLDREASAHVMRRWRFQPASVDGRPSIAWARVPIGFRLERG